MGERRDAYWVLARKPERRRPLGRWEDIIKMDIREEGWGQNWDVLGNLKYCSIKIFRVQVLPVDVRLSLRFCFY
jgi:hypothetical protein